MYSYICIVGIVAQKVKGTVALEFQCTEVLDVGSPQQWSFTKYRSLVVVQCQCIVNLLEPEPGLSEMSRSPDKHIF